jgi:hypothetical protein
MLVVDKEKYKMVIYEDRKQVHVQVIGFIKEYLVNDYLTDLQETSNKVKRSEYTFIVDATYQSPLPAKVVSGIGDTMMFYVSLGFKHCTIVNPKSKIGQVQLRNALEGVPFPGNVVDNVSQIK